MTDRRLGREILLTGALPGAVVLLNHLGMGFSALTWGRALGLLCYGLLALFLCLRALALLWRALGERRGERILSALLAALTAWLLLVWPFTPTAGRLNDRLYRRQREESLTLWRAGELQQAGGGSWYVGPASWDREMWVREGEAFVFLAYTGFLRGQSAVYSPQTTPTGEKNTDLGGGWYWVSQRY